MGLLTKSFVAMKFNKSVSSARRTCRRNHFQAPSNIRRKLMSAPLSADLRSKYNVRSMPVRKDDVVRVVRGTYKGRDGKIIAAYRKKFVIHIERICRDKANGAQSQIGIDASKVVITSLKLDVDRNAILARKNRANADAAKGEKFTELE